MLGKWDANYKKQLNEKCMKQITSNYTQTMPKRIQKTLNLNAKLNMLQLPLPISLKYFFLSTSPSMKNCMESAQKL